MAADFLSMGTTNIIRAEGSPNFSMWYIAVGCIANVVLDYIFIMEWNWGIAGAAWATGISKVFSTLLMFWHFSVGPFRYLTLRRRNLRIDRHYLCAMSAIGLSPLILQSINSVLNALINTTLLRNGGDKAVASMTCISTIIMLIMIPTFGVMMGYQPIVGYNYGAEQFRRVAQTLKGAFLMSEIMTLFLYIPVMIFAPAVVGWFCNSDPDVVPMAAHGLRVFFTNGYYDTATHIGIIYYMLNHAGLPMDRVSLKGYPSGHMIYIGEDNVKTLSDDVRSFVEGAMPSD